MSCLEFLYSGAVLHYKPQVYCEQWKVCVWKGKSEKMKNKWLSAGERKCVWRFGRKSAWLDSTQPDDVHDPGAAHEAKLSMSLSD